MIDLNFLLVIDPVIISISSEVTTGNFGVVLVLFLVNYVPISFMIQIAPTSLTFFLLTLAKGFPVSNMLSETSNFRLVDYLLFL